MSKSKDTITFVCSECGSKKVQAKAWVNLNNNKIDFSLSEDGRTEDYWCEDCEEHTDINTV